MGVREVQPITTNERGDEVHPAFARISASRVSAGGGPHNGAVLFDSDLVHQHYVTVKIETATRHRDLNRDWIHGGKDLIEVSMSASQWAQFVSSMNTSGTSATLTYTREDGLIPGLPYEPRMAKNLQEVRDAAGAQVAAAREALAAYKEHKTVGNLRKLETALEHAESNTVFVARSLSEHVESTMNRAKADIEAMVTAARKRGVAIDAPNLPLELEG